MNLDAQHDRSALTLATVPDETHTEPNLPAPAATTAADTASPETPASEAPQKPTDTFEAFGSFS